MPTDKDTITRTEYLQLLGLMELARRANEHVQSIVAAAVGITGDKDGNGGWTADECYSTRPSADGLLERLNITVVDDA